MKPFEIGLGIVLEWRSGLRRGCFCLAGMLFMLVLDLNGIAQQESKLVSGVITNAAFFRQEIAKAQRKGDVGRVKELVAEAIQRMGSKAGEPEVADRYEPTIATAANLTPAELEALAAKLLRHVQRVKWWKPGLNPEKTEHLPREVGYVIAGMLALHEAGFQVGAQAIAEARDAGDYLLWTQKQGGNGVIPFPLFRGGKGAAFEAAERFIQSIEKSGKNAEVVRNGWVVDDLEDGGLQFDNGICGSALFDLYRATREKAYLEGAKRSAAWARNHVCVPNWNYNSFSVRLLAKAFSETGDREYLEAAKAKSILGVIPGQLTSGNRSGRWADAHNARPAYHYIMVRALVTLVPLLGENDPERPEILRTLVLALKARNPEFGLKGIMTKDSAVEALLETKQAMKKRAELGKELQGCSVEEAQGILTPSLISAFREGKGPLGPAAMGMLLKELKTK